MKSQNIFLIGPMGAGKTTIGRYLANELKYTFYDTDKEIETRTGANIPWIFDVEGEAGFRKREEQAVARLTALQGIVMATGGGCVLSPNNRALLASRGIVIYLQVSIAQQMTRLSHAKDRPLLKQGKNLQHTLEKLVAEREPLYIALADFIIETDHFSPRIIAQDIITKLKAPLDEEES